MHGVYSRKTTFYNPAGNGQCEGYNFIFLAILLILRKHNLPTVYFWGENVVSDAPHLVRSLLCIATNVSPHKRFFLHQRRTCMHVRQSKNDSLLEKAELIDTNPN